MTIEEISKASGYSSRQLHRLFDEYLDEYPTWTIRTRTPVYLLIDGTYYSDNHCLIVYRAENTRRTLFYRFSRSEDDDEIVSDLMNIRAMGYEVLGITTDGGDNIVRAVEFVIEEDIPFDIPDSWCWMRLGCLVYCETGLAYSKDNLNEKSESMIRVLRGGNIDEGRWSVKDDDVMISSKYVREELLLKRGTFITPAVTSLERMAKTALIETDLYDTVAGGFVLMLKPFFKHDAILGYLNLLFQTTYYKQYCIGITNKSGQAFYNLSRQKLMKCMIPIAPKYESLDL